MPKNITQYDLLISCPSDVQDEILLIDDVVNQFNTQFTDTLGIAIRTKHWSKNSYAQSGGTPQSLLNKQFVNDCDAAIAIFWTRFGTPTDKYESGTEEEIENMLSSGKQVFMYFSDKPLPPSLQNPDEYAKVQNFRNKYKSKGLYFTYSTDEKLKNMLFAHLSQYFLSKKKISEIESERNSVLKLMGINQSNNLVDEFPVQTFVPVAEHTMEEYKSIINTMCSEIASICVGKKDAQPSMENYSFSFYDPVQINDNDRSLIASVAEALKIELPDSFFELGNLTESSLPTNIFGSREMKGSPEEKDKYYRIQVLVETISKALDWAPVEKAFADKKCFKFAIQNCGTAIDEDIEIMLNIPRGVLLTINEFPRLNNDNMGYMLNDCDMGTMFGISSTPEYLDYSSSRKSAKHSSHPAAFSLFGQTPDYTDAFISELDSVFNYSIYESENGHVLKLKVDYIKHNTAVAFPSVIFIKEIPSAITYSITSKNNSSVIYGEIKVV